MLMLLYALIHFTIVVGVVILLSILAELTVLAVRKIMKMPARTPSEHRRSRGRIADDGDLPTPKVMSRGCTEEAAKEPILAEKTPSRFQH